MRVYQAVMGEQAGVGADRRRVVSPDERDRLAQRGFQIMCACPASEYLRAALDDVGRIVRGNGMTVNTAFERVDAVEIPVLFGRVSDAERGFAEPAMIRLSRRRVAPLLPQDPFVGVIRFRGPFRLFDARFPRIN